MGGAGTHRGSPDRGLHGPALPVVAALNCFVGEGAAAARAAFDGLATLVPARAPWTHAHLQLVDVADAVVVLSLTEIPAQGQRGWRALTPDPRFRPLQIPSDPLGTPWSGVGRVRF